MACLEALIGGPVTREGRTRLRAALPGLKPRAETLKVLSENAAFYVREVPLPMTDKARKALTPEALDRLARLEISLAEQEDWSESALEATVRDFAERQNLKLGAVAQPLRAALTGSHASPGLFEVMAILGRAACMQRLESVREPGRSGA